ncbi:hypothetical protein ACFWNL_13830 [Kitasatospora sp. NPDC058397]|uniref:hypothetical protein n=1 Tax=unclassified Kitasatospora TaxID=2633591 RepID=UPI00364F3E9E
MRDHLDQQAQEREKAGENWKESGHVFTPPDGHPIEPATFTRHLKALLRDAIDLLSRTLGQTSEAVIEPDDGDDPPLCAAPVL